jgi:excinuclease ABC subunit C
VPKQILLSEPVDEMELLAAALGEKAGRKISLLVPQRGEKRDLVEHVIGNAREAHGRKLAETASQSRLLEGFKETFKLSYVPQRVEIYDNSHIMGTNAVGGMVVAGPEGFVKNQYRKFNIKSTDITPGDDFGMMREVMTRRFSRLIKEEGIPDRSQPVSTVDAADMPFPAWPDVILIDGGQGQMTAVRAILEELGITDSVTAIGVAKGVDRDAGRERFFPKGQESFTLPPRDPVLYFIQRMRDEAHRFAIGSHRARRKKEMVRNPLDEIGGIGPSRKRALLQHFGTAKAVSRAALSDLMAVEGISEAVAKQVYNHFHDDAAK